MTFPADSRKDGGVALTERQIEVLRELDGCDSSRHAGHHVVLPDGHRVRMYAPMEFGGRNGSHHSATATALAKLGLVDRYKYHGRELNKFDSRHKGACVYALTEAGRAKFSTEGRK